MAGNQPQKISADRDLAVPGRLERNGPRQTVIRAVHLSKHYGPIEAVRGIDLDVREGEIFGLIGPDGAGKTSTFQILAGVMEANGGVAEVVCRLARQGGLENR